MISKLEIPTFKFSYQDNISQLFKSTIANILKNETLFQTSAIYVLVLNLVFGRQISNAAFSNPIMSEMYFYHRLNKYASTKKAYFYSCRNA